MHLVFFNHPPFLGSQSMPRFAQMLVEGMRARGHSVEVFSPKPRFHKIPAPSAIRKWLGYVDRYLVFPAEVRRQLKNYPSDTLFVFTDQALGPWVPLVADRPHVIHCHDFLALRSALNEIPQNPTGWTGRQYQAYIRRGFSRGKHFLSVSRKTQEDLHRFLPHPPASSKVVYNGLNQSFPALDPVMARMEFGRQTGLDLRGGYLLHVGGNQWYKNRPGLVALYNAWRRSSPLALPLLLVGSQPDSSLAARISESDFRKDIHALTGLPNEAVRLAYAGASTLVFPSRAEGFGWPIVEAMASGCPVVTTHEAPMTEVAGLAGFLIPSQPTHSEGMKHWLAEVVGVLNRVLELTGAERQRAIDAGLHNALRFDSTEALDRIEAHYQRIGTVAAGGVTRHRQVPKLQKITVN